MPLLNCAAGACWLGHDVAQMSWKEPDDDKDPWGGPNGSPDLDEWIKRLRHRLAARFSKKPGGGDSGKPPLVRWWWLLPVAIGAWLLSGFFSVGAHQQAVLTRFGAYVETLGPGLHWHLPWPFAGQHTVDVAQSRSYTSDQLALTSDGKLVEARLTVAYKISQIRNYLYSVDNPASLLDSLTNAALRSAVGATSYGDLRAGNNSKIVSGVQQAIAKRLRDLHTGLAVTKVHMDSVTAPQQVSKATEAVAQARQHSTQEIQKAKSYASKIVPQARARAKSILSHGQLAQSRRLTAAQNEIKQFERWLPAYRQHPAATQETLYLDTMQLILTHADRIVLSGKSQGVTVLATPSASSRQAAPAEKTVLHPVAAPSATTGNAKHD